LNGLLPAFGSPEWSRVMSADPYALRAKGLEAPLTPYELGRAFYHLAKKRHFKERDAAEKEGESRGDKGSAEDAKDEDARESFIAQVRASGATLGQLLARRDPIAERKRGEHATRSL